MDGRKQQFGGYATHSRRARRRRPPDALVTDDWPAYQDLPGVRHNAITLGPMAAHIALSWIQDHFGSTRRSFKTYHHFCFAEKNGQWPIMSEGSATLRVVAMERLGGRVRGGGSAVSG